jgi:hypothetical protein
MTLTKNEERKWLSLSLYHIFRVKSSGLEIDLGSSSLSFTQCFLATTALEAWNKGQTLYWTRHFLVRLDWTLPWYLYVPIMPNSWPAHRWILLDDKISPVFWLVLDPKHWKLIYRQRLCLLVSWDISMFLCSLVYGKYNNESYNLIFDTIGMYYYKYALPLH